MTLVLASTSPRRAALLEKAGLAFAKVDPLVGDQHEEDLAARWRGLASHAEVSQRLAIAKALAAARRSPAGATRVIAGDTVVTIDGNALGKAKDRAHAKQMLELLAGRTHEAATGVCVHDLETGRLLAEIEVTRVTLLPKDDAAIEAYLASEQWVGKAGAYGLQDPAFAPLLASIEGSHSNVVGFPVERVLALLAKTGYPVPSAPEAPKPKTSTRLKQGKSAAHLLLAGALLAGAAGCPSGGTVPSNAKDPTEAAKGGASGATTPPPPEPAAPDSGTSTTMNEPFVPDPDDGQPSRGLPEAELTLGGKTIKVELALTDASRQLGLMHRPQMDDDHGMLFVFPERSKDFRSFWMKNTLLPLSIAYLRDDGTIVNVEDMEPLTRVGHYSKEKVRLALEMNKGWFKIHGLGPGAKIEGAEALLPRGE